MVKGIVTDPSYKLHTVASEADIQSDECKRAMEDLWDTYRENNSPKGLSAPQISKPLRVIICRLGKVPVMMINPTIEKESKIRLNSNEGCESVKSRYIVKRPLWLRVSYTTENGQRVQRFCWWGHSRVVSHECDHLLGKLISDYPSKRWVNVVENMRKKRQSL